MEMIRRQRHGTLCAAKLLNELTKVAARIRLVCQLPQVSCDYRDCLTTTTYAVLTVVSDFTRWEQYHPLGTISPTGNNVARRKSAGYSAAAAAASTGAVSSALAVGATQTGLVRMRSKAAFCLSACVPLEPYFLIRMPALSVG